MKNNSKAKIKNLVKYMGTRENDEGVDGQLLQPINNKNSKFNNNKDSTATRKQQDLIRQFLKEIPEVKNYHEYLDYKKNPTKNNATELLNTVIENNADKLYDIENLIKYMAKRSRSEGVKNTDNALFTDEGVNINLSNKAKELSEYKGKIFNHVISLTREDATKLGADNAEYWKTEIRDLLRDETL